jgi:hypothetical protein
LQKIDQEASKQKRSRSEWIELHFEDLFFKPPEIENKKAIKSELNQTRSKILKYYRS